MGLPEDWLEKARETERILEEVCRILKCGKAEILDRVKKLVTDNEALKVELEMLREKVKMK